MLRICVLILCFLSLTLKGFAKDMVEYYMATNSTSLTVRWNSPLSLQANRYVLSIPQDTVYGEFYTGGINYLLYTDTSVSLTVSGLVGFAAGYPKEQFNFIGTSALSGNLFGCTYYTAVSYLGGQSYHTLLYNARVTKTIIGGAYGGGALSGENADIFLGPLLGYSVSLGSATLSAEYVHYFHKDMFVPTVQVFTGITY